jgi:AraC-like DNA-binding protein
MHNFRIIHSESKAYRLINTSPGLKEYQHILGWSDYWIGDHLIFSHRKNRYSHSTFPEQLHSHDYYELLILRKGDISFISDDHYIFPHPCSLLLFHPGSVHTAKMITESDYERYVFLFDKEAFNLFGCESAPLNFLHNGAIHIEFPPELEDTLFSELRKITNTLSGKRDDTALLAYSMIAQLLCLIDRHAIISKKNVLSIPQNILKVKQYIDDNYLTINTTAEIADHFFYRREYVSRSFKEFFNSNLSDYVTSLKIRHSQELLRKGASVTDACFKSGFRNMSTFTSSFRNLVKMTPSAYRKAMKIELR